MLEEETTLKERERLVEASCECVKYAPLPADWRTLLFDERQRRLIEDCQIYAQNDPAGMPGHNLALIIAKFADLLDGDGAKSRKVE